MANRAASEIRGCSLSQGQGLLPATGDFYFQAFDDSVSIPYAGYDYDIDWTPMSAGLAPAGMAATADSGQIDT